MAISLGCENMWEPCFGTLARAPLAGGAPRELLENVGSADWSPDGKDLAAIHVVEGHYRLEYPLGKVLYKADGYLSHVRFSPDGTLIAFLDHPHFDSGIGVVSVVDLAGHKRTLTNQPARVRPLLWSPDGKEIFFDHWSGGGREIKGVTLSGRVRHAPWVPSLDDVSRQGLFLDSGAMINIRRDVLALLPGAAKEVSYSYLKDSTAADLSPDGKQMLMNVYQEEGIGTTRDIYTSYLRSSVGADAKLLGEGKSLALSPDLQWALVLRNLPAPHLTLLPTGPGDPRDLPGGGLIVYHWASFFPDGRRILIAAEEKGKMPRTYIQDVAGGPPRSLEEEGMRGVLVSPDGQEIAGSTLEGLQLIYRADGTGRPRHDRGRPADGSARPVERRRKVDHRPGSRGDAPDALPHRSRDGKSRALEGASSSRPDRFRRVRIGTLGRSGHAGRTVLRLHLLLGSGDPPADRRRPLVVEVTKAFPHCLPSGAMHSGMDLR